MSNAARNLPTQRKPQVPCFGLHKGVNDVWYLFQDQNPQGYDFRGQKSNSGLFTNSISGRCPHSMNIYLRSRSVPRNHSKKFKQLIQDPLVKAMTPLPHTVKSAQIYYFNDSNLMLPSLWLKSLERMSSPLYSQVVNINSTPSSYISQALKASNIHPLVIYDVTDRNESQVSAIIKEAVNSERTVIFIGEKINTSLEIETTEIHKILHLNDLVILPLEHIGVRLLDNLVSNKELPW